MGAEMRGTSDSLAFYALLEAQPYRFDFFYTLRKLESINALMPRIGTALKPADEPIRFGQEPDLGFAPATISKYELTLGKPARMEVRFFGMFGPNGALPTHLTEYARGRLLNDRDPTFVRFADIFHHRFLALFYRAWSQAQPTVSLDRPKDDRFATYVGSAFGLGTDRVRNGDTIADSAKLFFAGLLSRQVRNKEGLEQILSAYFRVPIRVEEFVGHWLTLPESECSRMSTRSAQLGQGAVLGSRVWDRQHKIRVWVGALSLQQYEDFLPGGTAIEALVAWMRQYFCFELEWDARLVLDKKALPRAQVGKFGRLGWTTWLGSKSRTKDIADLTLDPERLMLKRRGENNSNLS